MPTAGQSYTIVKTWREILPSPVNTYIVGTGQGVIVVDAGAEPSAASILQHLAGREAIVVLTHYHWDHSVGAVGLLRAGYKVYAPEETIRALREPEAIIERTRLIARMAGFDPRPLQDFFQNYYDGLFEASDKLSSLREAGIPGLEAIPCPGHTWDHYCYRIGNLLFTGDLITPTGSTETLDVEAYLHTTRTLLERSDWNTLLPGHGEPLPRRLADEAIRAACSRKAARYARLISLLREHATIRADKLLVLLYNGEPRDPFTAFDRAYSLLGYLNPLVAKGAVELAEKTDGVWVRVVNDLSRVWPRLEARLCP